MAKGKLIIMISLAVLVVVGLAFSGGIIYQYREGKVELDRIRSYYAYTATPVDVSVEQAIAWLDRAAFSHQHHLENDDLEDDEFHKGAMDRYASIKALLLRLEKE